MWSYICLPLLLLFWKDIGLVKAFESSESIVLHNQTETFGSSIQICPPKDLSLYYKPVIGILSHPGDGTASRRLSDDPTASYIAASYVKFAEAGGARVIPLIYNEPLPLLLEKLELVNGVIYTGGSRKSGRYFTIVKMIFERALERNDAGEHFPVYGICLGFELMSIIISGDPGILETVDSENTAANLKFVEDVVISETVFGRFSSDLLHVLEVGCLAMQNHKWGITPAKFRDNHLLSSFFEIVTTSFDENNKIYVSTASARDYPITGFQWHPEKNAFEWGLSNIPHSEKAIQVTQHVASHLVSEARRSSNIPSAVRVRANLIYNYMPTYCGYDGYGYDEVYIFTQP